MRIGVASVARGVVPIPVPRSVRKLQVRLSVAEARSTLSALQAVEEAFQSGHVGADDG